MNRSYCLLLTVVFTLASCGSGSKSSEEPNTVGTDSQSETFGLLIPVASANTFENYVRQSFTQIAASNSEAIVAMDADSASVGFTTTYRVETNVDEHDYVKYNGEHLFIAPSRGMDCCFIVDDIAVGESAADNGAITPDEQQNDRSIRILSTNSEQATAEQIASIDLPENRTVEGLYSHDTKLVSISSTSWWGIYGERFADPAIWEGQTTAIDIYDVSNISEPSAQLQIEIEGGFVNSRKKGDIVYLVARHTPSIDNYTFFPNEEQQASNQAAIDALNIDQILPKLRVNGDITGLLNAEDCRITDADNAIAPSAPASPIMTMIIAIDLQEQEIANAICYLDSTSGIYVSENAIYLTQVDYSNSADESIDRTIVHSFSLSTELNYLGSGAADGQLVTGSNRDFRINEHEEYLRLITTTYTDNSADRVDHQLSILRLADESLELETIAILPNAQRPDPIGKPNEELYGVRFMGDKVYMVTFERIDPLYAIDLADPTDPKIAGELTVTGFSDFLHPVNNELLLGLGGGEDGLVKLELFNIADINAPYSLGARSIEVGATWSYSEARYNRHAFTYQVIDDGTDRFTIPVSLILNDEIYGYSQHERLYLFEINGKDNSVNASLYQVGYIDASDNQWWDDRHRAVIHDDAVFFINGTLVWSTLWTDPSLQNGPY